MQGLARRMLSLDPYRRPSVAKLLLDDVFGEFRAALAEEMVPERAPPVAKTHRMVKTNHTVRRPLRFLSERERKRAGSVCVCVCLYGCVYKSVRVVYPNFLGYIFPEM
jgi:hypothetical protein